jgi:hypothetical protein
MSKKLVIRNEKDKPIVKLINVKHDKIYAIKVGVSNIPYKLTGINDKFSFVNLAHTYSIDDMGVYNSITEAIENLDKKYTVWEFDNLKEFRNWCEEGEIKTKTEIETETFKRYTNVKL